MAAQIVSGNVRGQWVVAFGSLFGDSFEPPSGAKKVARGATSGKSSNTSGALKMRKEFFAHLQCANL
jgi:hypothetical protein